MCQLSFTRSLGVPIASRRAITTIRRAFRLRSTTRRTTLHGAKRCSLFRIMIRPFHASSKTASTSVRAGGSLRVVERSATERGRAPLANKFSNSCVYHFPEVNRTPGFVGREALASLLRAGRGLKSNFQKFSPKKVKA